MKRCWSGWEALTSLGLFALLFAWLWWSSRVDQRPFLWMIPAVVVPMLALKELGGWANWRRLRGLAIWANVAWWCLVTGLFTLWIFEWSPWVGISIIVAVGVISFRQGSLHFDNPHPARGQESKDSGLGGMAIPYAPRGEE
ncbi:MAG: hypothetical protein WAO58_07835 [Fimbriimonadaceae bacterium]